MGLGRERLRASPRFTPDGIVLFPEDAPIPLSAPIREGLNSFANAAICDIVGAQEAFFRAAGASALAHRASVSRAAAGCYTGNPPSLVPEYEEPPFVGGQCGVLYDAYFGIQHTSGPEDGYTNSFWRLRIGGPVTGWEETQFRPGLNIITIYSGGSGVPFVQTGTYSAANYSNPRLLELRRIDGLPDSCGNVNDPAPIVYPPGQELPPAPSPGQEVYPPGITTVDFNFNGTFAPVGFFHGSANIDLNGNVNLNFGGIDVNISPDLGFDFGDDGSQGESFGSDPPEFPEFPDIPDYSGDFEGLGDALDSIGNKQDVLGDSLDSVGQGVGVIIDRVQEVKDLLAIDFDDTMQWVSCRGIEDSMGYEGTGLRGLESALKALLALVNLGSGEYCEILPSAPLAGTVIRSEFFPAREIDNFFDVDIDSEAKAVSLEISLARPSYSVRRGSDGSEGDLQGRYGVVSFLEEVVSGDWQTMTEPVNQYYSVGLYRVPKTGNPARIRVSVSAGSTCTYRELV